jgi:hypothetical protein
MLMNKNSLQRISKRTLGLLLIECSPIRRHRPNERNPTQGQQRRDLGAGEAGRKTVIVPGYDKSTIGPLVSAFTKKYPFIDVSWQMVTGIAASQSNCSSSRRVKPRSMSSARAGVHERVFQAGFDHEIRFSRMAKVGSAQDSHRDDR